MASILIKILPLDLAATLSPGVLALAIILLGSKNQPKAKALILLLGMLLVAIAITVFGFILGNNVTPGVEPTLTSAIIDAIFGLFFLFYGFKIILGPERMIKPREEKVRFWRLFILGFLVSATNFDALFLSFAAAKEVGDAAVHFGAKSILLAVNIFFFTLPIMLPLIIYLLFPEFAGRVLANINRIVLKYSRYILFAMFMIFGIYFLSKSLGFFI